MIQSIAVPTPPRFHYSEELGWICDTTIGLTPGEMMAACKHVKKVQLTRASQLPAGDRRDAIINAVAKLSPSTVQQHLIGNTPWQVDRYPFLKR